MLGLGSAGKSSLTRRLIYKHFSLEYNLKTRRKNLEDY